MNKDNLLFTVPVKHWNAWTKFFSERKIDPGSVFKEPQMTSSGQGNRKSGDRVKQSTAPSEGGKYGDPRINS